MNIPKDFPVQPLKPGENVVGRATCGVCGLAWDDAKPTEWTPAPSGRCPFEYFHEPAPEVPYAVWRQGWDAVAKWKAENAAPAPDAERVLLVRAKGTSRWHLAMAMEERGERLVNCEYRWFTMGEEA